MKRMLRSRRLHLALVIVLGFLVYSNTFNAPFQYDDEQNISENPSITSLTYFSEPSKALRYSLFNKYPSLIRRYVTFFTFALNYTVDGTDVRGYHVVNLSIHLATSLVIYWLILLVFQTPFMARSNVQRYAQYTALFASLLFAVHPVQTQAVTYIVQRMTSLATLFYLTSLACYIQSRLSKKKGKWMTFYVLALCSAVLGMKSKEIVFTLPLAVALFEWSFLDGPPRKRFGWLFPMLLTLAVIPLTQIWLARGDIGKSVTITAVDMPRLLYLATELRVIVTYLRLVVLPMNQNLLYDYHAYASILSGGVLVSILLLACLFLIGVHLYRKAARSEPALRVTAYGIFFFFLSLAVESTVVPLHPIYEHRLYLPFAGISLGAATGVFILLDRLRTRKARTVLLAAVVIAPVLFGISAYSRNNVWSSSIALWEDTAKKSPNELRAHINLGNAYLEASRYEDAMRQYQRALQLRMPDYHTKLTEEYYSDAYYNIAVLNDKYFGDPQEAETAYLKSLRLNNSNVASMGNLGTLYYRMGDASKAESYYKAAVDKQPYYSPALTNLANLYILKKEYGRAIPLLQRALESTPTDPKAHYNIALAFRATGNMGEAIRHLKESLRDQPDYFLAASALGETYEMQQQPDKAIRSLEYALTIAGDGDNTGRTHYHLGRVLASIGRTGEAVEHLNKALKKYPGNKDIIRELRELEEVTH